MGGFTSHDLVAYQEGEASSETDYRGSLRMLTDMLTRQHTAKKHRGKVLLLGLDGAGKSTLANHLSRISIGQDMALYTSKGLELPSYLYPDPTRALQTASYRVDTSDRYLQLVDLPGRRTCRAKWYNATSDSSSPGGSSNNLNNVTPPTVANFQASLPIVAALFVVDISDATRFPIVATELVRLLKHKSKHKTFTNTQLFLIVNKIDHFLPPLPAETPEEPEAKEYQQLVSNHKQQQRAGIREARRELRRCVDYELRMDQRRHPVNVGASNAATSSKSKSLFFAAPAAVAGELGPSSNQRRRSSNSTGASSVANSSAASSVFTNAAECCGQDRDSVRALSGWLNEELKKPPPP
ncbi:50S ribosome-binding GTPase [Phytophthora infestans]|uniref:50S ribosome-binding GTPase n=1 Tax=Phytophthora infestans TaxID=4787 RepID=A0A8S9UD70_PHYIN|nr:50S ribosome-binding GTPase [Phytophthora infestans]